MKGGIMPYANLLHIYDADDDNMRQTASIHSWRKVDVKEIGVRGGIKGLKKELDKLLYDKWIFPKVVFFTHGNSGSIYFNKERIDQDTLRRHFANRGYERLFPIPLNTRMYFSGCNVAEDDVGWIFLEIAASIFLKTMGGVAFGFTSKGFMFSPPHLLLTSPLTYLIVAGKSIHPTGNARYVYVGPGGNFIKREG